MLPACVSSEHLADAPAFDRGPEALPGEGTAPLAAGEGVAGPCVAVAGSRPAVAAAVAPLEGVAGMAVAAWHLSACDPADVPKGC